MQILKLLDCIDYDRHKSNNVEEHGRKLAEFLSILPIDDFKIELDSPPGLLISSFFITFFRTIDEADRFELVKRIEWVTKYDFQKRNIELFLQLYQDDREKNRRIKNIIDNLDTQKDWTLDDYRDFYDRDVNFLLKSFVPHLLPAEQPCEANS